MSVYVPIGGSTRALLPNSRAAGPVDPNEIASVTVRLRSRGDPAALAAKAYEIASKPLAQRQYLTHAELEKQHGADRADLDTLEHFAQSHNLMVAHRSAAERSICSTRFTPTF
jgi:kumamolisin